MIEYKLTTHSTHHRLVSCILHYHLQMGSLHLLQMGSLHHLQMGILHYLRLYCSSLPHGPQLHLSCHPQSLTLTTLTEQHTEEKTAGAGSVTSVTSCAFDTD